MLLKSVVNEWKKWPHGRKKGNEGRAGEAFLSRAPGSPAAGWSGWPLACGVLVACTSGGEGLARGDPCLECHRHVLAVGPFHLIALVLFMTLLQTHWGLGHHFTFSHSYAGKAKEKY